MSDAGLLPQFPCLLLLSTLYNRSFVNIIHNSCQWQAQLEGGSPKRYSMRCQHRKPLGIHTCECVPAPHINGQFHFDLIVQDCMPHIYRMPEESKLSDSSLLWSTLNARSWAPSLTHRCPLGTLPALEGPHVGFVKLAHRLLCIPWGR